MAAARVTVVLAAGAALVVAAGACSSGEAAQREEPELEGEPERIPDPPPRYKRAETDAGIPAPDDESEPTLQIRCGGNQPYVCPLDDGTFRCSDHPCVPGCDRVGCLGGEICTACDGEFRCVALGDSC